MPDAFALHAQEVDSHQGLKLETRLHIGPEAYAGDLYKARTIQLRGAAAMTPSHPKHVLDADDYDGLLVDLDGVVTRSAGLHALAWKRLFDEVLHEASESSTTSHRPFDPVSDYRSYVDGKPRLVGLRAFLTARGLKFLTGRPSDTPQQETLYGMAARKNQYFHELLISRGVEVYPSSLTFLRMARRNGWKLALVSSSRNCEAVMETAGLNGLFHVKVDGNDADALGLRGKPAADTYREAAKRLNVEPERAVVIEDAVAGVLAGREGAFGCVVGLDRGGMRSALRDAGADLVLTDLSALSVSERRVQTNNFRKPNALKEFEAIARRLEKHRLALFLDYDGTLAPIASRPELARLSEDMRGTLQSLGALCSLAIVSGRARRDLKDKVDIGSIYYAGSHGFDISGPGGQEFEHREGRDFVPSLAQAAQDLKEAVAEIDGALIENKIYAVAAHYRLVRPEDVSRFCRSVKEVAGNYPQLKLTDGKKILELRPNIAWDKGHAVLWLLDAISPSGDQAVPIYIGDDVTDEDAFSALRSCGIGILVADKPMETAASYSLCGIDEVQLFLKRLTVFLQETPA